MLVAVLKVAFRAFWIPTRLHQTHSKMERRDDRRWHFQELWKMEVLSVHSSLALPRTGGLGRGVGYSGDDEMICLKME